MAEVLIIDTTYQEDRNFNDALTNAVNDVGFEYSTMSHLDAPSNVERLNNSHAVILAGVPLHYPAESAEDLQPNLTQWLPKTNVPVLGICLGHQAIGLAFGATMRRDIEIEIGTYTAEVLDEHQADPIFKDLGNRFEIACLHWASISIKQKEAPNLLRLARSLPIPGVSIGCENQVIRVADSQIYGAQFHPENSESGKLFLLNFLEL